MENRFKVRSEDAKKSLFDRIEKTLGFEGLSEGLPTGYFPHIMFLFFLALVYIGNGHYSEKSIRKLNRLETEVEDLRADYTTLKAEYMLSGKQSEVAEKTKNLGLKESMEPPYKIERQE